MNKWVDEPTEMTWERRMTTTIPAVLVDTVQGFHSTGLTTNSMVLCTTINGVDVDVDDDTEDDWTTGEQEWVKIIRW